MTYISKYYEQLIRLRDSLSDMVLNEILENESEIKSLIKSRWEKGLRPDGDSIGTYRSASYSDMKNILNPTAQGYVDLILTGDLVNKIKLTIEDNRIEIISTDEKFTLIGDKYGYDNFNISDKDVNSLLNDIAYDLIINSIKKIWG